MNERENVSPQPSAGAQLAALQESRLLVSELLTQGEVAGDLADRIHRRLALSFSDELGSSWLRQPWMHIALAFLAEKEFDWAREIWRQNHGSAASEPASGYLLGLIEFLSNDLDAAAKILRIAIEHAEFHLPAWCLYGDCLLGFEWWDEARRHFSNPEFRSQSPIAEFMQSALTAEAKPKRRPEDVITDSNEATADAYDAIARCQNYQADIYLRKLLHKVLPTAAKAPLEILHAGCKTGWLAKVLEPYAARIVGQESSSRMRAIAARRGIYDELLADDLPQTLEAHPGCYDLIVALEVMENFGDLRAVLNASVHALRPGGWMLFSVNEGSLAEEYELHPTGYFLHSPHYLIWLLGQHGAHGGTMHKVQFRDSPLSGHCLMLAFQKPQ